MAICGCFSDEVSPDFSHSERDSSKPRKCTDLLCLVVFLLFWAILIFISSFAFIIGSPLRLIHGSDSFGNTCGHRNERIDEMQLSGLDMTDRPYLFHLDQTNPQTSLKICVKSCPKKDLLNMADIYLFYTQSGSSLCRYDYNYTTDPSRIAQQFAKNTQLLAELRSGGPCPKMPVDATKAILYRCIPAVAVIQGQAFGHTVYEFITGFAPLKKVISDLINSYREISVSIAVSVGFAFFSAFVIHFIAGIASWLILTAVSIALIALTVFLWYAYIDTQFRQNIFIDNNSTAKYAKLQFLQEDIENDEILFWIAILTTVVSVVLLVITCALRTRVRFVVALFKEAAACIRSMPLILLQPIWTLLCLTIFLVFWLTVLLSVATADHAKQEKRQMMAMSLTDNEMESTSAIRLSSFTLIDYSIPSWTQYMWWYLIIAFIWTSEFILSCQQMVIAGAVSQWYFTRDKNRLNFPIGVSIKRLFLYHLGSVAMGSFLITLFKVPRLVITYAHKKLKGFDNCLAKNIVRCCTCCLWLIEKFVQYLNRNAYTVIAIEGRDFCPSARIAFNAIVTNALRVTAINSVGDFVLFLGKISVAAVGGLTGAMLMKNNPVLHYWSIPVVMVTIIGFWIAHCILSVYEMIIDTLFLCFCEDYNRNDGTPGKEYYSPPSLMQFLTCEEVDCALKPLRSPDASDL